MVLAQYSDTDYGIRLIYIFDAAINFYYFIEILQIHFEISTWFA